MNKYIRNSNTGSFRQMADTPTQDVVMNNANKNRQPSMSSSLFPSIDDVVNEVYPQKTRTAWDSIGEGLVAAATGFASGFTGQDNLSDYLTSLGEDDRDRGDLRKALAMKQYDVPDSIREFAYLKDHPDMMDSWSEYQKAKNPLGYMNYGLRAENVNADNIARDESQITKVMDQYKKDTTDLYTLFNNAKLIEPYIKIPKGEDGKDVPFSFESYNPDVDKDLITPQTTFMGYSRPNVFLDKDAQAFNQASAFLETPYAIEMFGKSIPAGGEGKMLNSLIQSKSLTDPVLRVKASKIIYDIVKNKLKQYESGLSESPYGSTALDRIEKTGGQTLRSLLQQSGNSNPVIQDRAKAIEELKRRGKIQ